MDCEKAKARIDFLQYLETDMSLYIMSFLHDPADLVRASFVSRLWHRFVIENGFAKELCLKTFSGCSNLLGTVNKSKGKNCNNSFEMDHEVYATLLYAFQKSEDFVSCGIRKGISASSTNNYPTHCIAKTFNIPNFPSLEKDSYWSSNGQSNAHVPETLTYRIKRGIWAITDIYVRPCPAEGSPNVYSAKSVRFRIGHSKSPRENEKDPMIADDEVEWTYTSPEFPMKQERRIQSYKLSQPVLCFDGYLKIELLGRVQRHQNDGLFYICVNYVRVIGHRLFPAFDAKIHERYGKPLLLYSPDKLGDVFMTHPNYEWVRPWARSLPRFF